MSQEKEKVLTKLGILLSGRGSNFEAIAEAVEQGRIPAEIAVVISNRPGALGLEKAGKRGLEALCLPSKGRECNEYDRALVKVLEEHKVDWVCLAGFMRLLSSSFIRAFPNRVLNIHPSLLPAFPGLGGQRQALEWGVKFSGCTVHIADESLDGGPILMQAVVPVLENDTEETLSERILEEEHKVYPEAVRLIVEGRIRIQGRRVFIMEENGTV